MSDVQTLKAWCHWKRKEQDITEDELLFVKAVEDVVSQAGMAPVLKAENKRLRTQLAKAREGVEECKKVLELIDVGERDGLKAPEDALVKTICEQWGYGAVIDSAARLWREKDKYGAFTAGPCVVTVQDTLGFIYKILAELAGMEKPQPVVYGTEGESGV